MCKRKFARPPAFYLITINLRLLSYHHTPSACSLLHTTVGNVIDATAARKPDHLAVVSVEQNIRKTYAQYKNDVDEVARGLLALGVKVNSPVAVMTPNIYEWLVLQFAIAKTGAVFVCINSASQGPEIEHCLNKAGCEYLVISELMSPDQKSHYRDMITDLVPEIKEHKPNRKLLQSKRIPTLKEIVYISDKPANGFILFDDLQNRLGQSDQFKRQLNDIERSVQFSDVINVQFTSGTTGSPKGVLLTHHNVVNNAYFIGNHCGMNQKDMILLLNVPLFHSFGWTIGSLASAFHGQTLVLPSMKYNPIKALKAAETERCSFIYGAPTMFIDYIAYQRKMKCDLSSVQSGIIGGASCPVEVIHSARKELNIKDFYVAYGLTETSPAMTAVRPEEKIENWVHTVGRPLPHLEVKIVDPHTKRIVPKKTRGEVCCRGYNVFQGYHSDPKRTDEVFYPGGWFRTGDEAVMHEDGSISITGRLKDVIIRGGENVYPAEIEDVLYHHPAVQEVQICGVPDQRMGEEVCAWIMVKSGKTLTEEDIRLFCEQKMAGTCRKVSI